MSGFSALGRGTGKYVDRVTYGDDGTFGIIKHRGRVIKNHFKWPLIFGPILMETNVFGVIMFSRLLAKKRFGY